MKIAGSELIRNVMLLTAAVLMLTAAISSFATDSGDQWRPRSHFTVSSGWINDPNGLVYNSETGEYHLFFQHNQTVKEDIAAKSWGHAVSTDLVHWTELESAILPDELGAIWSGSAVIDRDNTSGLFDDATPPGARMVAFFTYYGASAEFGTEKQGMAYSVDNGRTWCKYDGNPVVYDPAVTDGFRDPKVFRVSDGSGGEQWAMLVAGGAARLYTSRNLINWSFAGFCKDRDGDLIRTECPDLYPITADDGTEHWVFSCAGRTYYTGSVIAEPGGGLAFEADSAQLTAVETPTDMYACQTFSNMPDGRRVGIYWLIDNTMQNSETAAKLSGKNWDGVESLPVEFRLIKQADGYRLALSPAAEVYKLVSGAPVWTSGGAETLTVTEDGLELYPDGDCASVYVKLKFKGIDAARLAIEVLSRGEESTSLTYSFAGERLTVVRGEHSGIGVRENMFMNAPADIDGSVTLELFIDRSAVAIFDSQGHTAQGLVFPTGTGKARIVLRAKLGKVELISAEVYELSEMNVEPTEPSENVDGGGNNNAGKKAGTGGGLSTGLTAAIIAGIVLLAAGAIAAILILKKPDANISDAKVSDTPATDITAAPVESNAILPLPADRTGKAYWQGKTAAYLGDSITELGQYQIFLRQFLDLHRGYTFAVSGTQLTGFDRAFTQRAKDIDVDTDLIFVLGGTNDFHVGAPLGTIDDPPSETTFYGALKSVCETLKHDHPDALIVFATPTRRTVPPGSGVPDLNSAGLSLKAYRDAIIEVCARYGIPVLDLYMNSRITEETADKYLMDGLHPNREGFEQMAKEIAAYLCPGEFE